MFCHPQVRRRRTRWKRGGTFRGGLCPSTPLWSLRERGWWWPPTSRLSSPTQTAGPWSSPNPSPWRKWSQVGKLWLNCFNVIMFMSLQPPHSHVAPVKISFIQSISYSVQVKASLEFSFKLLYLLHLIKLGNRNQMKTLWIISSVVELLFHIT